MKKLRPNQIVIALLVLLVAVTTPWWLVKIPLFGNLQPNEIGDYVGGIGGFVTSIVTMILVYMVWTSEREDDRKTTFKAGLMTLLQLHVDERQRVLGKNGQQNCFRWFWMNSIDRLLNAAGPDERMAEAEKVYNAYYDHVASWFLSVLRVIRYIQDSEMSDVEKHNAMKLFRLFCEREEQRALYLLLFTKDETAESPRILLKHDFFKHGRFTESEKLVRLQAMQPAGWGKAEASSS